MSDIVDRLRRWHRIAFKRSDGVAPVDYVLLRQAADEIERLRVYEDCTGQPDCTCYAHRCDQLAECRSLLRGIVKHQSDNHTWLGTVAGQEWLDAARKAAGGDGEAIA